MIELKKETERVILVGVCLPGQEDIDASLEVRVRVADTDRLMRTIDFVIAKERDEENGEDEW